MHEMIHDASKLLASYLYEAGKKGGKKKNKTQKNSCILGNHD